MAAAKLVDSYVVVKQTEWDKDTDKPEKWPDAVAKAWKELPGMIRGNRLDILSNPTYNKTLISALAKYQR